MKTKLENQKLSIKRLKPMVMKNIAGWLMLLPTVVFAYFIIWRPIVMGFYQSLFDMQGSTMLEFVGLENYKDITTDTNFTKVLFNTFKYTGFSLLVGFLPPVIVAILLNEVRHIRAFFKTAIYLPVVLPGIAVYMLWYYLYLPGESGLLNTILASFGIDPQPWLQDAGTSILWIVITMTWQSFGGSTLMYLAALQGINRELYEAAEIDGAGMRKRLRYIMLPEIYPIALLLFIRQIIGVFQVMEQPLAMTGGGPNGASTSLALLAYKYAFEYFQFDKAMATGVITFIILVMITGVYLVLEKKMND